jgi:hypothetical protein
VAHPEFPCLGRRSVFRRDAATLVVLDDLADTGDGGSLDTLGAALAQYADEVDPEGDLVSFVACFRGPVADEERDFEALLWGALQHLHDNDDAPWADGVAADPETPTSPSASPARPSSWSACTPTPRGWPAEPPCPRWSSTCTRSFERMRGDGRYQRTARHDPSSDPTSRASRTRWSATTARPRRHGSTPVAPVRPLDPTLRGRPGQRCRTGGRKPRLRRDGDRPAEQPVKPGPHALPAPGRAADARTAHPTNPGDGWTRIAPQSWRGRPSWLPADRSPCSTPVASRVSDLLPRGGRPRRGVFSVGPHHRLRQQHLRLDRLAARGRTGRASLARSSTTRWACTTSRSPRAARRPSTCSTPTSGRSAPLLLRQPLRGPRPLRCRPRPDRHHPQRLHGRMDRRPRRAALRPPADPEPGDTRCTIEARLPVDRRGWTACVGREVVTSGAARPSTGRSSGPPPAERTHPAVRGGPGFVSTPDRARCRDRRAGSLLDPLPAVTGPGGARRVGTGSFVEVTPCSSAFIPPGRAVAILGGVAASLGLVPSGRCSRS